MNVLIIEDEPLAASHLENLLHLHDASINVLQVVDSVKTAVDWFNNNEYPSLIFMDVHLGDGNCFEIFKHVEIKSFIIFTTAYNQYALQAFKVNSIDYLLKPLNKEMLTEAMEKFNNYSKLQTQAPSPTDVQFLLDAIQNKAVSYKERFVVKVGSHIKMVATNDIACFYSFEKGTYILTKSKNNYLIDHTLDKLIDIIDPTQFFRINRKQIIEITAISDVLALGPARLKVKLDNYSQDEFLVSRDRIKPFKLWLEG